MPDSVIFNHLGHCVTDLSRARRFYEELFGFEYVREVRPPDEPTATLLNLDPPVGLTALYLRRDGLVLELLHYERPNNPPARERVMNEPGLTHISLSVPDPTAVAQRVPEFGGSVLAETDIGRGIFVRDPDGQLMELLSLEHHRRTP